MDLGAEEKCLRYGPGNSGGDFFCFGMSAGDKWCQRTECECVILMGKVVQERDTQWSNGFGSWLVAKSVCMAGW